MASEDLARFLDSVCSDSHLRVESDFGGGYVRLRSTEAERRQAAQDIQSCEDVVVEVLRNSRDAHAKAIFLATWREGNYRHFTILDDGDGIPAAMHERIFEPRVTSKLDTAHMDKWGIHGRGMALYSISVNADECRVMSSDCGLGTAISIKCDTASLKEKTDQSTFPVFSVLEEGTLAMRGPKNIIRTACEFALEHRKDCTVYLGSPVEIAAALYHRGVTSLSSSSLAFCDDVEKLSVCNRLAASADPAQFVTIASEIGLPLSSRSARRILDGTDSCLLNLFDLMKIKSFPVENNVMPQIESDNCRTEQKELRRFRLANDDMRSLSDAARIAFEDIASRYYLNAGEPSVRVSRDAIHITIPFEMLR